MDTTLFINHLSMEGFIALLLLGAIANIALMVFNRRKDRWH